MLSGVQVSSEFPGPRGPGLIEALILSAPLMLRRPHFRGRAAPASLKPHSNDTSCTSGLSFPGPRGPGLIEAPRPERQHAPRCRGFPGPRGPGLIEALPLASLRKFPVPHFRGRAAPASLKLGYNSSLHGIGCSFPGPRGPGLIEANANAAAQAAQGAISGAARPRPH